MGVVVKRKRCVEDEGKKGQMSKNARLKWKPYYEFTWDS